jgi:hypothetical protein
MRRINFNSNPYDGTTHASRVRNLPIEGIPPGRRRVGRPRTRDIQPQIKCALSK